MAEQLSQSEVQNTLNPAWQERMERMAENLNNQIFNQESSLKFAEREKNKIFRNPLAQTVSLGTALGSVAGLGYAAITSIQHHKPMELFELCKHVGVGAVGGGIVLTILTAGILPMEADPKVRARGEKYQLDKLLEMRELFVKAYGEEIMKGKGGDNNQWYRHIKDLVESYKNEMTSGFGR